MFQGIHGEFALIFQSITNQSITLRQQEIFKDVAIPSLAIANIDKVISSVEKDRTKESMLRFLTEAVASDRDVSPMVRELVEAVLYALINRGTAVSASAGYVYDRIEEVDGDLKKRFLANIAKSTAGYVTDMIRPCMRSLVAEHAKTGKENSLFLEMAYALALGAHNHLNHFAFSVLLEKEEYYPLYMTALEKARLLLKSEEYRSIVYCSLSPSHSSPLSVTKVLAGFEAAGCEAIKALTFSFGRQNDSITILGDAQMIAFFCKLTSSNPRQQALDAWKSLEATGLYAKKLRILSKKLSEALAEPGEQIPITATVDNFSELFPKVAVVEPT